jgi:hypothetical protein
MDALETVFVVFRSHKQQQSRSEESPFEAGPLDVPVLVK